MHFKSHTDHSGILHTLMSKCSASMKAPRIGRRITLEIYVKVKPGAFGNKEGRTGGGGVNEIEGQETCD